MKTSLLRDFSFLRFVPDSNEPIFIHHWKDTRLVDRQIKKNSLQSSFVYFDYLLNLCDNKKWIFKNVANELVLEKKKSNNK